MYKVRIQITTDDIELDQKFELEDAQNLFIEQSRDIYCADCGLKFPCHQESCSGNLVGRNTTFKLVAHLPNKAIPKEKR